MKVTGFAYAQNSNNGYPLLVNYNATTKRLLFTNITGVSMTFTSIDFGIIMTE